MTDRIHGPTSHSYISQRLRLHYVDWGNHGAPPLLLVHGGRDHCRNWDWIAEALRDDYHIIAPDLRGHGDSQWMIGGSYSVSEFVYDIAQLIHQAGLAPLRIMGHSLGGVISLRYAGIYPETVIKLVAIEGLGLPPQELAARADKPTHVRMSDWIDRLRDLSGRLPRRYTSLEEAFQRMHEANPHLDDDQARHLTIHGVSQNEDGSYSWKFDNYVRAFSPEAVSQPDTHALWARITCPTLLIRGLESWSTDPHEDGRADHFQNATFIDVENAGHWVHHDRLDLVIDKARAFLAD
jgi:pimeloyl-ACP methyl ester carboxylesterase